MSTITTQLANRVLKLRREGMTVAQMALRLNRSESEILDAHRMLGIGIAGESVDQRTAPSDEKRAAARANWSMKWQQRYEKRR